MRVCWLILALGTILPFSGSARAECQLTPIAKHALPKVLGSQTWMDGGRQAQAFLDNGGEGKFYFVTNSIGDGLGIYGLVEKLPSKAVPKSSILWLRDQAILDKLNALKNQYAMLLAPLSTGFAAGIADTSSGAAGEVFVDQAKTCGFIPSRYVFMITDAVNEVVLFHENKHLSDLQLTEGILKELAVLGPRDAQLVATFIMEQRAWSAELKHLKELERVNPKAKLWTYRVVDFELRIKNDTITETFGFEKHLAESFLDNFGEDVQKLLRYYKEKDPQLAQRIIKQVVDHCDHDIWDFKNYFIL